MIKNEGTDRRAKLQMLSIIKDQKCECKFSSKLKFIDDCYWHSTKDKRQKNTAENSTFSPRNNEEIHWTISSNKKTTRKVLLNTD